MLKNHSLLDSIHLVGLSKVSLYLIYEDKKDFWWQKFLKKGYQHVYAVSFDGFFHVKTDYTLGYLDCSVLPYYNITTITNILDRESMNYQYVEVWRKTRYRRLFAPQSCVEMMKALLGIKAWWVFTPWQLKKYCEAQYGKQT